MSGRYWRGLPPHALPGHVWQAEYTHLRAVIALERERVQIARSALASQAAGQVTGATAGEQPLEDPEQPEEQLAQPSQGGAA